MRPKEDDTKQDFTHLRVTLSDGEKRALECLETIRLSYYKCFADRRDFEWKLSMAIWTSMAIYLSALVIGKDPISIQSTLLIKGTEWGAVGITLLHSLWLFGTGKANGTDKSQAFQTADAMCHILGLEWSSNLNDRIKEARGRRFHFGWSQYSQLIITILLGALAVLASHYRAS